MKAPALTVVLMALVILLAVISIAPLVWMVSASFMPSGQANTFPPPFFPSRPTLEQYEGLFTRLAARKLIRATDVRVAVLAFDGTFHGVVTDWLQDGRGRRLTDAAVALKEEDLVPRVMVDAVVRLGELDDEFFRELGRFEPGGGVSFHHHEIVGAKLVARRLKALRFDKETVQAVARLTELHLRFHGYGEAQWTDSAVRRYVTDAGPLLERLHRLTRSDCTTRNRRKAERLRSAYDDLERRIAELAEAEELASIRPDLDGEAIMTILGVPPGPVVGQAYRFLLELRLDRGPLPPEVAEAELRAWWAGRSRRL